MAAELLLAHCGSAGALELRDELTAVYLAARADQAHNPFYSSESFLARLVDLYVPGRDFGLVTGTLDGALVGFAFGSPRDKSAEIWEAVNRALPQIEVPAKPEPVYIFRELNVHPDYQRHGYGRKLHDALLGTRPEKLSQLLVRPDNIPARSAYFSWGWRKIGEKKPFPDSPVFDVLVRSLPVG
jgi:GNAT superfamily N-acetyltransferase